MHQLLAGAIAMGLAVASLFFLRFWRETRERLFAWFALGFFVLSINRVGLALSPETSRDYLYWVRFIAYCLILLAIIDKNRSGR